MNIILPDTVEDAISRLQHLYRGVGATARAALDMLDSGDLLSVGVRSSDGADRLEHLISLIEITAEHAAEAEGRLDERTHSRLSELAHDLVASSTRVHATAKAAIDMIGKLSFAQRLRTEADLNERLIALLEVTSDLAARVMDAGGEIAPTVLVLARDQTRSQAAV